MIEVELKFEITSAAWPRVRQWVEQMQFKRQVHNSDRYYDTGDFRLLDQAVFMRVRNMARLECKFNEWADPAHTQCVEQAFALLPAAEQASQMNALFTRFLPDWRPAKTVHEAIAHNHLHEMASIENQRMQYALDDITVCVDHVARLGDFLEMEIQCREQRETPQALIRLERLAATMALRAVKVGYVERWLQKYNPPLYQKGKYHETTFPSSDVH